MEDIKERNKTQEKEELYNSLLKGMSEVLVLSKKPKIKRFNNSAEALNHDLSFLRKDLFKIFIEKIKELSPEEKNELKNKLLEKNTFI